MTEKNDLLTLLHVVAPPDTAVSVASELRILELLGIVSNPDLVKAIQVMVRVVPPATPATVKGLFDLLGGLIKMNPKTTKAHHDTLTKHLDNLATIPDAILTYGTFLSVCEKLMQAASHAKHKHAA